MPPSSPSPPSADRVRLGTASPSTQSTTAATLDHLEALAHRAAKQHIDVLLLPEAYIGGYPRGSAFGCVVGNRSVEGRDEYLKYFQQAVDLGDVVGKGGGGAGEAWLKRELPDDPVLLARASKNGENGARPGQAAPNRGDGTRERLEAISSSTSLFLITGLIERAGGSLYCSAVYICPRLGIIGKRRKVLPTATERLIWAQGSPSTLKAVSTVIRGKRVNMAAAICWESYMPMLRQTLYNQNVNLYLAPTADGRDAWCSLMRTVGVEGRCFVVSSNMCVPGKVREGADGKVVGEEEGEEDQSPYESAGGRQRRKSIVTEDGHEIALPIQTGRSATGTHDSGEPGTANNLHRPVLASEDEDGTAAAAEDKDPYETAKVHHRRKSLVTEDGHEIMLPLQGAGPPTDTAESKHPSTAAKPTARLDGKEGSRSFISRGGSCIVDPFGGVLAGPQWEDPDGIIYADVDFDDCIRGRLDLDTAGSYSRNDAFQMTVEGLDMTPLSY